MLDGDKANTLIFCICIAVIGGIIAAGLYYILFVIKTYLALRGIWKNREIPPAYVVASLVAGWIGLVGFWLVSHTGYSQVYFLFISILFIVGASFRLLEENDHRLEIKLLIVPIVINTIVCGWFVIMSEIDIWKDDSMHFAYNESNAQALENPYILTKDELDGLEWIRDNTEIDSIIATNRLDLWNSSYPSADDDCRCFYYSAFAERPMCIEGFSYCDTTYENIKKRLAINSDIYSAEQDLSKKAIQETGVDYVIVTKRFNAASAFSGEPVYDNEGITVFKVR